MAKAEHQGPNPHAKPIGQAPQSGAAARSTNQARPHDEQAHPNHGQEPEEQEPAHETLPAPAQTASPVHKTNQRAQELRIGARIATPATLAFIPLGLALGVLVVQAGLAWWWAPIFAAVVYAGSLEFLLVSMVATGLPLPQIAITAFLVNFRHVFYALTFPLGQVYKKRLKVYSTFALTDEAYALTLPAKHERWSQERILTIQTLLYVVWIVSVAVGAGFGTIIPPWIRGLEFAVSALFIVLALDAYKMRPSKSIGLSAIGCAVIGIALTPGSNLLTAMAIFLLGLTVLYVVQRRISKVNTDD